MEALHEMDRLFHEIGDLVMDIRVLRAHAQFDLYATAVAFMPPAPPAEVAEVAEVAEEGKREYAGVTYLTTGSAWYAYRASKTDSGKAQAQAEAEAAAQAQAEAEAAAQAQAEAEAAAQAQAEAEAAAQAQAEAEAAAQAQAEAEAAAQAQAEAEAAAQAQAEAEAAAQAQAEAEAAAQAQAEAEAAAQAQAEAEAAAQAQAEAEAAASGAPRNLHALKAAAVSRGWAATAKRDGETWTLVIDAPSDSRTGRYSWTRGRWAGNPRGYRETLDFYATAPAGAPGAQPVKAADAPADGRTALQVSALDTLRNASGKLLAALGDARTAAKEADEWREAADEWLAVADDAATVRAAEEAEAEAEHAAEQAAECVKRAKNALGRAVKHRKAIDGAAMVTEVEIGIGYDNRQEAARSEADTRELLGEAEDSAEAAREAADHAAQVAARVCIKCAAFVRRSVCAEHARGETCILCVIGECGCRALMLAQLDAAGSVVARSIDPEAVRIGHLLDSDNRRHVDAAQLMLAGDWDGAEVALAEAGEEVPAVAEARRAAVESAHRPRPAPVASPVVTTAALIARAEAEAVPLAAVAADRHAWAVDMADLLAELDKGCAVLDVDPADARQWARAAASVASAAAMAADGVRYDAERWTREAERTAAELDAARARTARLYSGEGDDRARWTSADGRTVIALPRTLDDSPTAEADARFAELLAGAVAAKDAGRTLKSNDVPNKVKHGRGPGADVRQAVVRASRPLVTPWKAPRVPAAGKPLDSDALAALDADGVCAEVEAAPGVWLPRAAVYAAETAAANGWTVAMERHPSGTVTVRAAGVLARGTGHVAGEVVAVWVDGMHDADRSGGYLAGRRTENRAGLSRVLATVGQTAAAGEITAARPRPRRPRSGASAPAPAGISDPAGEDGWESEGGAVPGVDAPRARPGSGGEGGISPRIDADVSEKPWSPAPEGERWDIARVRQVLAATGLSAGGYDGEGDGWMVGPDMWNVMISRTQGDGAPFRPSGARARATWDAALDAYEAAVDAAGMELVRRNRHVLVVSVPVPPELHFTARARRTGALDDFTTAVEFEGWAGIGGTVTLHSAGAGASWFEVRDHTGRGVPDPAQQSRRAAVASLARWYGLPVPAEYVEDGQEPPAARAARLRAEAAERKAEAARQHAERLGERAHDAYGRFAGGQPILRGHHSERGARRDKARADAIAGRAVEALKAVPRAEADARKARQAADLAAIVHGRSRPWERADFQRGDVVEVRKIYTDTYVVVRANGKSLTLRNRHTITDTKCRYDQILSRTRDGRKVTDPGADREQDPAAECAAVGETPQEPAPVRDAPAAVPAPAAPAAPDLAEADHRVRAALTEAADHPSGEAPGVTNSWVLQELLGRGLFTAHRGIGSITEAGRRAAAALPRERVVIVPCGGAKREGAESAPAGEMYVGSYHRACRRAAETLAGSSGQVMILSAKYGLLKLSHYIAPYDLRAGDPGTIEPAQLRYQAHKLYVTGAQVTVLGGAEYVRLAREVWPDAEAPLSGSRGIGEQLARLASIYKRESPAA